MIRQTTGGVELDVRVIPRAKKTEASGVRGDAVVVRVAAPPSEGAANVALIGYFATALSIPRRAVRIVGGERSRRKRIFLEGVAVEVVRELLRAR